MRSHQTSKRRREVIAELVRRGRTQVEVARLFGLSNRTVSNYCREHRVYRRRGRIPGDLGYHTSRPIAAVDILFALVKDPRANLAELARRFNVTRQYAFEVRRRWREQQAYQRQMDARIAEARRAKTAAAAEAATLS